MQLIGDETEFTEVKSTESFLFLSNVFVAISVLAVKAHNQPLSAVELAEPAGSAFCTLPF